MPVYMSSLLTLTDELGHNNVFISIYENDSNDKTPVMLQRLDEELARRGVRRRIMSTKQSESTQQLERIERLSVYRNFAMAPINDAVPEGLDGRPFDKVIWINDVVFEPNTVHELLDTEGGEFDQACAMDFCWLEFYDTWVMRDADGKTTRPFWPYFKSRRDRTAVADGFPVPVNSCWNGITAFDARWFARKNNYSTPYITAASTLQAPMKRDDVQELPATLPLTFRKSDKCYASESLLCSLDMHRLARPFRPRIFVNPNVVVTYDKPNYYLYHDVMKWHVTGPWRYVWLDWVESRLLDSFSNYLGRVDKCTDVFMPMWVPRSPLWH